MGTSDSKQKTFSDAEKDKSAEPFVRLKLKGK